MRLNCVRRSGALRRESRNCSRADVKDDRLRFGLVFGGAGVERRNATERMADGSPKWNGAQPNARRKRQTYVDPSWTVRDERVRSETRRPRPGGGQGRPVDEKWNAATVGPGGIDVGKSSVQTTSPSEADKAFALPEPPCGWGVAACTPQRVVLLMKLRRGNSILPPEYGAGQLSGIFILS